MSNLNKDLESLARNLRIAHRFRKLQWMPPKASNPKLEDYIEATMAEEPELRTPKPNLSKKEARILQELGMNRDIVIKKADKGSCIVVQDRRSYVSESPT